MIAPQKKHAASKSVHPIVNEMTPATRERYTELKDVYEATTRNELLKRHEIGIIVDELTSDEKTYGQNVLLQLCEAIGVGNDFLYRSRTLARTWTREEIESLRRKGAEMRVGKGYGVGINGL